jgi:protein gp37
MPIKPGAERGTAISWTTHTWNPTFGCSKVSAGCDYCYAETLALKFRHTGLPWTGANAAANVTLKPGKLGDPRKLRAPSRIFVNSMSDLFHALIPDDYVRRVFDVMAEVDRHTYQILTKRPERMRRWCEQYQADPLPNVWLGTSVEDQTAADRRLRHLIATPAAVRFISAEPLLGPVDLGPYLFANYAADDPRYRRTGERGLDWVIVGGESGLHLREHPEREMDHAWARDLRDQCAAAGVAYFFKQSSGYRTEMGTSLVEADGSRTHVQEFPEAPTGATVQAALL